MNSRIVFGLKDGKEISLNNVKDVRELKDEVDSFLNGLSTEETPPSNGEVENSDLIMENFQEDHVVKIKELKKGQFQE